MRDQTLQELLEELQMKARNLLIVILLIASFSTITLANKLNEKVLHDEAVKAISIGDDAQIFEHFMKQRSAPLSAERRAYYKKELFNRPDLAHTPLFDSDTPKAREVFAVLSPVLAQFQWQDSIEVVVIDQKAPFIGLYRESIFIVTTSVIKMLTSDQIRASFAHELAHQCFIEELIAADRAQDAAAHHLVEYKCDLIAALALNNIGQSPFTLIDGIAKIEQHYRNNSNYRPDISGHPESPERKKCLEQFLNTRPSANTQAKNKNSR
jgi:hypothetical protein